MNDTTLSVTAAEKRQKRYKLYFWLMDACLIFGVIGFVDFIYDNTLGGFPDGQWPAWYAALAAISIFFSFFVAPFLIVARFMRDEYAEQVWQRATDALVYIAVAIPFLVFAAATVVYVITRAETAPYPFSELMGATTWYAAIAEGWKTFCLLFVAIFEFLRWKDSR